MLDLIDELAASVPEVTKTIYVDDVNLEVTLPNPAYGITARSRAEAQRLAQRVLAQKERCAQKISTAVNTCTCFFGDRHKTTISVKKSCFIAAKRGISARAELLTWRRTVKAANSGKIRGFATNAGRARSTAENNRRVRKFSTKTARSPDPASQLR